MKILKSLLFSVLAVLLVGIPAGAFAKEITPTSSPVPQGISVNSFELFWPIVAGKVMGERFYSLKSLKESVRGFFIFDSLKRSEYAILLSEKRTVEAEKLFLTNKNYENGKKTLDVAQKERREAVDNLKKAKADGRRTKDLENRLVDSFKKQRALLDYVLTQISEGQKSIVEENISQLDLLLASLVEKA